jgi:hypothetical protein
MKSILVRIAVWLGFSFALSSLMSFGAFAPVANACSFAMEEDVDPTVMLLKEADQKLDDGDPETAYAAAMNAFPISETTQPLEEKSSLEIRKNRALRIAALAVIRTGDAVDGLDASPARIAWARGVLEAFVALRDGPLQRTDLAEAREATDPEGAQAALEALAARDVVATPYGYGTLARLRDQAGDTQGGRAALASCQRMAAIPTICAAPPRPNPSLAHAARRFMLRRWTWILVLASLGALAAWIGNRLIERATMPQKI